MSLLKRLVTLAGLAPVPDAEAVRRARNELLTALEPSREAYIRRATEAERRAYVAEQELAELREKLRTRATVGDRARVAQAMATGGADVTAASLGMTEERLTSVLRGMKSVGYVTEIPKGHFTLTSDGLDYADAAAQSGKKLVRRGGSRVDSN